MKINLTRITRLALLVAAPFMLCRLANPASAASIGTPTYTSTVNTSPQTNDLTHLGLYNDLDWQIYSGIGGAAQAGNNPVPILDNKAGGGSITNLGMYFGGSVATTENVVNRSATKYAWSDGAAPNTSSAGTDPSEAYNSFRMGTATAFGYDVYYETFVFTPGDTNSHTIYLYGFYNNGNTATLQFETSLAGVSTPPVLNPAYVAGNFVYSVTFQADHPTDALTVKFTFNHTANSGITALGISAASIANYVPPFTTWVGNGGNNNWDTTTANWSTGNYVDGATAVRFDDTATQFGVNVSATVSPLDIYVTNSANDYTISGSPIAGSGSLLKTGSRTLTLSGANTFSGGLNVSGGYLTLGASGTLPNGAGAGAVTVNSGATLNLNGFNQTVNGLNGGGTVDIPTVSGGTSTLTVGGNNAAGNFNGNIQNTFGTVSLIKIGTNALTLSGTNSFSGGVQLNAGQLNLNSATALGSGPFTIAGGTTLDNASGAVKTLSNNNLQSWNGDFTFLGTSSLNLGSGAVTLASSRTVTVITNTLTVGGIISGAGYGLTKNGSGQLSITGSNTFSGPITVNGGTLYLNTTTSGGGALTLGDGANLQVVLAASEQSLNVATLAFGATSSNTNTVTFNFGGNTNHVNAIVTSAGSLTVSNNVVINISVGANPALVAGQYPLIKYAGSLGGVGYGAFSLGTTPANSIMNLVNNTANHSVDLSITVISGPPKTWIGYVNGAANSTWDINTTSNWIAAGGTNLTTYNETALAGDSVLFNDTASNFVVNVTQAVKPAAITVNNTNNNYVLNGASPLTSLTTLTKQGTMALTISGNNTFSNGVTLSGGTLRIGSGASPLGTGLLNLYTAGVTLSSDGTSARTVTNAVVVNNNPNLGDPTNNGVLSFTGPMNLTGGQTFKLYSDAIISGSSTNGSISLSAGNTNTPNLTGTNTLTLHGVHTWSAGNSVYSGTLLLDGAQVTNSGTGNFQPAIEVNQTNGLARLIITNGGALVLTATNVTMRLGTTAFANNANGGTNSFATNELDVAGLFATPNSVNKIIMGRSASLAVINLLPGGTMQVGGVTYSDLAGDRCPTLFNFNGGTLSPTTNSTSFLQNLTTADVLTGGAIFNTAGYNITVNQALLSGASPDGGLTKNGNGTLTLGNANTYTGPTTVNQGELILPTGVTLGGDLDVADGGSLGVNVTAQNAVLSAPNLTFGSTAAHNGTLDLNFGGIIPAGTAPLASQGNLSASGTTTINVNGTNELYVGQFPLIQGSGPVSSGVFNSFALGTLPAGNVGMLVNNTGNYSIDLKITTGQVTPLTWYGYVNNDWDIATTANWNDPSLGQTTYTESGGVGRAVVFNDSTGSYTVNVTTLVSPSGMTVNNSSSDYTIGGAAVIGGTGSLVKSGTAGLTLTSSNAYTGGTTVSSGIVRLGADGALGGGLVTLSGGALSSDSVNARTLLNAVSVTATNTTTLGDPVNTGLLTLDGVINWNGGKDVTISSAVLFGGGSTNGGFGKAGTGVLTVQGVHTLRNYFDLTEGDEVVNGATINSTAGNFVRIYCTVPGGQARLMVTNGAVFVSSNVPTANIYVGFNTNGDATATNLLELAGRLATTPGAVARLGASCALAQVDLLAGGVLEVGAVESDTNAPGESLLNFNGGTLRANAASTNFLGGLSNAYVLNGGAILDSSNYNITVTQPLLQGGSGGLTIVGNGTVTLDSINTYTNTTLVSAGTLAGSGAVSGPLSVGVNGSLAPGDAGIGTFTINGALTLAPGCTNFVAINATSSTSDLVTGLTKATYAGTLVVSNLSGTPALNQSFQIFSAVANPVGNFSSIIPVPATNLVWVFNPTNGVLKAVTAAVPPPVANPDFASTYWNVPVTVAALANDTDPNNYALSIVSVSPTNGTASIVNGTNVLFTPTLGAAGTGYVGYMITNGNGGTASSLITVTLQTPPTPRITSATRTGGNLVINAVNGAPNGTYSILTATNITLNLTNWTAISAGATFNGSGSLSGVTIPMTNSRSFYLLKQ